jgi:hypothetical protein
MRDLNWLVIVEHVIGYGLALTYVVGMILLLNGIITWDMIWPFR